MSSWIFDAKGTPRVAWGRNDNGERLYWLSSDGENWESLPYTGWVKNYRLYGLSEDPNYYYVGKRSGQNKTMGVHKLDIRTGSIVGAVYENPDYDVRGVILNDKTHELQGVSYIKDRAEYVYFDKNLQAIHKMLSAQLQGTSVAILSKASEADIYLVEASNDRLPGMYFLYDNAVKKL